MTTGSGHQMPENPGGEWPGGENPVVTTIPFGTPDGSVCLLGGGVGYDGVKAQKVISGIAQGEESSSLAVTVEPGLWLQNARYNGLWFVLADGDGFDYWYEIDHIDTTNQKIYIANMTVGEFQGSVGDLLNIGEIHAHRDFMVLREAGSVQFTAIQIDHDGAGGENSDDDETSPLRNQLLVRTYGQGLRSSTPLARTDGSTTGGIPIDEASTNSNRSWSRLTHERTTRARFRLVARVVDSSIEIRRVTLRLKQWGR